MAEITTHFREGDGDADMVANTEVCKRGEEEGEERLERASKVRLLCIDTGETDVYTGMQSFGNNHGIEVQTRKQQLQ